MSICTSLYVKKSWCAAPSYEPTAYLNGSTGYFFLCQKYPEEAPRFKQVAFPVADLAATLDNFYTDPGSVGLRPGCDTYISQGVFASKDNRLATSCVSLSTVWLELDLSKAGLDPLATLPAIEARRIEAGLPPFSKINFSGHGLHCKYVFTDPIGQAQFAAWSELIASLAAVFAGFGVDTSVFDVSRVLRLPDTLNTEAGLECRTIQDGGDRYDFNDLCAILTPFKAAAGAAATTARHLKIVEPPATMAAIQRQPLPLPSPRPKLKLYSNPRVGWNAKAWVRLVAADLEALMYMRHEGGILPPHHRNNLLFPAFVYLAAVYEGDYSGFIEAARALCQKHCGWTESAFQNCISSLAKRHRLDCAGMPAPAGFESHVYSFKCSTLIERLSITPEEQAQLRALVDDTGRRERDRLRKRAERRAAGAAERGDYLDAAASRRARARQFALDGWSIEEIASALNVTKRSVYGYLAESGEAVKGSSDYSVVGSGGEAAVEPLERAASDSQAQETGQPVFAASLECPIQEEPAAIIEATDHGASVSCSLAPGITPPAVVDLAQVAIYWAVIAHCCFIEHQAEEAAIEAAWGGMWPEMEAMIDAGWSAGTSGRVGSFSRPTGQI